MSHRQAYFSSPESHEASVALGPAALAALGELYTGEDGLAVFELEGLGMVAARTVDGFTHFLVGPFDGLLGIELWDSPHWREQGSEIEEVRQLEPGPPDLSMLDGAPGGVHAALLEAALEGGRVVIV